MTEQASSCTIIHFSNPYTTFNDDLQNIDILQEECAELIKIASKNKRWGTESYNPMDPDGTSNRDLLVQEIGDVLAMIDCIKHSPHFNISDSEIEKAKRKKLIKLKDFYHFPSHSFE